MNINIKKLEKSEVEIEGEIAADILETYWPKAIKKIGENIEIDGFRKGKVPENILTSKIPEISILEEMAQMVLNDNYPKILEEEKIDAIGQPEITITKIARNNPLGFKIKTAVLPEIKLADYKKIAKETIDGLTDEEKSTEVSEEDVLNTIEDIRKSRAPKMHMAEAKEGDLTAQAEEIKEELPELNDEFVKGLGPFTDVADFKAKLKENIALEKANQVKEKTRLKIVEKIIDASTAEIPQILVDSEVAKILYRMESDITTMGLNFDDYLKHLNKTKEDLRKDFTPDGEKKAKLGLILNEIAKAEKIEANPEEVAKEVAHILEHYKDADPTRAEMHAENVLTNELIFQFLEKQA